MADDTRDPVRRDIAERGLTPEAVAHLTRDALGRVDLDQLAPVKQLLKRFFSDQPWTASDDDALAAIAGSGDGWWEYLLADGSALAFGWRDGRFHLDVRSALAASFDGAVVPEATPNPRTIRFVTGPIHTGPSRWYESADGVDDPRVSRVFAGFEDVDNVLVGPEFVAVGLKRPDRWEQLLAPMLRLIEATFEPAASSEAAAAAEVAAEPAMRTGAQMGSAGGGRGGFDRAWKDLGRLDPMRADDLARLRAAARADDVHARHVAARLFERAAPDVAYEGWEQLLADPSRTVRRAVVDAMVDADRDTLRPLLERALHDADAWIRWKALRGLVELGVDPSRAAIAALAEDTDFRVRLEATGAFARGLARDGEDFVDDLAELADAARVQVLVAVDHADVDLELQVRLVRIADIRVLHVEADLLDVGERECVGGGRPQLDGVFLAHDRPRTGRDEMGLEQRGQRPSSVEVQRRRRRPDQPHQRQFTARTGNTSALRSSITSSRMRRSGPRGMTRTSNSA